MRNITPPRYTSNPVTMEATKVPSTEKVTMAPKFEKKGLGCKLKPDWVQTSTSRKTTYFVA
jgi:hypothetical protein